MVRQHFETMIIRGKSDDMGSEIDPNQDTAIEDMTGYIERMGGKLHTTLVEGEWVFYNFIVPAHWVGRMYERFLSFGFRAKVKYESLWYGVLDEDEEQELRGSSNKTKWEIPEQFQFTSYNGVYV
jgi:hypothetical protein